MENIILTNNKDLRLVSVKVGVLSTLRFELPLVSASATHVEVIVTSGDVPSAYTATFIDATKRWQCDIAASQFPTVGRQSYEVAYVLDGKQFWDGKGWIEIENATTSGIEPQPRPEPYRYVVVSVNGYGADAQGAVRIPKTFIATDSPTTTEGFMEGDIYFNRETGATWTLCNVQGTLTWVFNYKNYYTKAETEEAIDALAAYYITYNAAGAAFPTRADLLNATTYYSGGVVRVPTRNDYAVVLADEAHDGAEYRYIYAVPDGATTGQWEPQYPIETNDYVALSNKPQINGNTLTGEGSQSGADLGLLDLAGGTMTGDLNVGDPDHLANIFARGNITVFGGLFAPSLGLQPDYGEYLDIVRVDNTWVIRITHGNTITLVSIPLSNGAMALLQNIADDFDSSDSYSKNALCIHDGTLYRCINENGHTGDWDAADFAPATVEDVLAALRTGKQDALSAAQLANIAAVSDALAFDATHSYAAGDPVVYNGTLYTFTAAHTGAWTGSDVSAVNIIARLAGKADDNAVVKLTGDQTIGGVKSFVDGVHIRLNRTDSDFQIEDPSGDLGTFTITNDMATGRWCFFARYWDNSICIASLPVNSGTIARVEDLAPDFSVSATYAVNALCAYENVLYRCWTAVTTAGDWTGSANWVTATVEDVLAALRTGKADVSAIPYALVTKTITSGAVSLDDRASNSVTVSATLSPNTLTINFPAATSGKVRDFAMRLNIAAGVTAPEIAWPQGVTLENDGGEVPEIADGGTGGSSTILYFSETENDGTTAKFLVKGETLTAITQA